MSRYVCPALVSFLAISATLIVTISILYWNYSETMYVLIITIIIIHIIIIITTTLIVTVSILYWNYSDYSN